MDKVRVDRNDLLRTVQANRDNHHDLFLQAQDGFRQRAIEELDEMIQSAKRGDPVRLFVGLTAPSDHTAEYDRALKMLQMSQDTIIEIDEGAFAQLVCNEWAWFGAATAVNSTYAMGGKMGGSR